MHDSRLFIKNWSRFQHYRDRNPPWIKLATSTFQDYEFSKLADGAKVFAIACWTLAARSDDGSIPDDFEWITAQCSLRDAIEDDFLALKSNGFLVTESAEQPATQAWASRYVSAESRAQVMASTGGKCAKCGANKNIEIDHIVPISQGGTGDISNLQPLCRKCNRSKRIQTKRYSVGMRAEQLATQSCAHAAHLGRTETEAETETEGETETTLSNPPDSTLFDVKKPTKGALRIQAVEEAFDLYLATFQRDGRLYKLTPPRRNIGTKRLEWLEPLCDGDIAAAKEFLAARIRAIAESKWHMGANPDGKKYIDWTDHIMNAGKFEKWFHDEVDKARGGAR